LSKFFRIYSYYNHKKSAELLPHFEGWLKKIVTSWTSHLPSELIFGGRRPSILIMLPELNPDKSDTEDLDAKLESAFSWIKRKVAERERKEILAGIRRWITES
jgi:hypothetical protein